MKIKCDCGALIVDQTDELPHKAYFIPDQEWFGILDAIDKAIDKSDSKAEEKDSAFKSAREVLWRVSRLAWQCRECGRLYVDDQDHQLTVFAPTSDDVTHELSRSRTPGLRYNDKSTP